MLTASPLRAFQKSDNASFITYGPAEIGVEVVETFGHFEAEYAAIRKGTAILDMPQRGLVEVCGADKLEFLHELVTNDVKSLQSCQSRRSFLLNRKGRIAADMVVLVNDDRVWIDMDVFQARDLPAELDKYIFSQDVRLVDRSDQFVHLALHGPAAGEHIRAVTSEDDSQQIAQLKPYALTTVPIGAVDCLVYRRDEIGAPGLHLLVPRDAVHAVYHRLADVVGGLTPQVNGGLKRCITGRGIGWLAYNTARIEAGKPIYHIDFGPDSLPHETGILDEAVSFTKGCYIGQEVVARTQSLGHPKQTLVGLRFDDERLPVAGSQVLNSTNDLNEVIGAITSSTLSPMLGHVAIAFAMMKWGKHRKGTQVVTHAEGTVVSAKVQALRFLANAHEPV